MLRQMTMEAYAAQNVTQYCTKHDHIGFSVWYQPVKLWTKHVHVPASCTVASHALTNADPLQTVDSTSPSEDDNAVQCDTAGPG